MLAICQRTSVQVAVLTDRVHRSEELLRPLQGAEHVTALNIVPLTPYLQLVPARTQAERSGQPKRAVSKDAGAGAGVRQDGARVAALSQLDPVVSTHPHRIGQDQVELIVQSL